jgi:phosphatidylglycerophosphatase A
LSGIDPLISPSSLGGEGKDEGRPNRLILIFATGLGVGYSPVAPGTAGTVLAVPLYLLLSRIPSPVYEVTLLTFFFFSAWVSEGGQKYFGRKDDQRIVIDEMMGFLVTMFWLPKTYLTVLLGFLFFRVFDILKPFPIRRLHTRCGGGYGVVLDDLLAGVYGNLLLQILFQVWL